MRRSRQMIRFEERLKSDPDVAQWSSYVGQGAIRFYLPLDQQLDNSFFGQFVIEAKSLEARNRIIPRLKQFARDRFVGIDIFVHTLDLGPPVGRPIQYRLSGPDLQIRPSAGFEPRQRRSPQSARRRSDIRLERAG